MSYAGQDIDRRSAVQELEVQSIFRFLGRNWKWLISSALVAFALGLAVVLILTPDYVATATLVVDTRKPRPPTDQAPTGDETGYVDTQVEIIQSDMILAEVAKEYRLQEDEEFSASEGLASRIIGSLGRRPDDEAAPSLADGQGERTAVEILRKRSSVERQGTSYVVEVSVRSVDPEKATRLANAIAARFLEDQRNLSISVTGRANAALTTRVISPAVRPLEPAGPKPLLILALAPFVGLVVGTFLALLRELLDTRLRTAADVERSTGLECLGVVPRVRKRSSSRPSPKRGPKADNGTAERVIPEDLGLLKYGLEHPASRFTEVVRMLLAIATERRTGQGPIVIGFAAAAAGAGQSTIAANCAFLAARTGSRTILIDADVQSASLSGLMAPAAVSGGPDLLADSRAVDQVIWSDLSLPLHFLPLGSAEGDHWIGAPPSWLGGVIERLRGSYEYVFVDLPPLLSSGDARGFAGSMDGVFIVVEWGHTRPQDVIAGLRSIPDPAAKVLGTVLSKSKKSGPGLYS